MLSDEAISLPFKINESILNDLGTFVAFSHSCSSTSSPMTLRASSCWIEMIIVYYMSVEQVKLSYCSKHNFRKFSKCCLVVVLFDVVTVNALPPEHHSHLGKIILNWRHNITILVLP